MVRLINSLSTNGVVRLVTNNKGKLVLALLVANEIRGVIVVALAWKSFGPLFAAIFAGALHQAGH